MKKTEEIIFKNTNKTKRSRSVEGHAPVTDCLTPCLFIFITLMPELKFVQLYLRCVLAFELLVLRGVPPAKKKKKQNKEILSFKKSSRTNLRWHWPTIRGNSGELPTFVPQKQKPVELRIHPVVQISTYFADCVRFFTQLWK